MIVICGATGLAGGHVVRALLARGERLRLVVRDPERARRLYGDGVELVRGDYADPAVLDHALDGAEALFLSGGDDRRRVVFECAAIDAAARAGVGRVVKLSSIEAEAGSPVAYWDWHGRIEEHLRRSGVPSVALHASFFMSNLLLAAGEVAAWGRLYAPAGEARIAMVDPRDVGEAAAAVLCGAGEDGATHVLTGPAALTYVDVAAALTAATGRQIAFVHVSDETALHGLIDAGMPAFMAEQVVAMFGRFRAGVAERATWDVERLTGRPPGGLASFLEAHADAFATAERMAG
jgi:uncharacterized protein YbjT (DUF2867 family)